MPEKERPLVLKWNQLVLDAICYSTTSPPLAARALAMVHTAMYDAWSVYNSCAISTTTGMHIKIPQAKCNKEDRHKAFSYASYRVLTELFCFCLPPSKRNIF